MKVKKNEQKSNDLLYGGQTVLEAIRAGSAKKVYIKEKKNMKGVACQVYEQSQKAGVPVTNLSGEEFTDLLGDATESSGGIAAIAASYTYAHIDDIIKKSQEQNNPKLVIMLDHVEDPHNLGAVIRTAEAAGVLGIIIPRDRAAGVTPAVRKVSAGATEWVKVAQVSNIVRAINDLKKAGFWVYGAEAGGKTAYTQADWRGLTALILGSEGRGLSRLVMESCDLLINIPLTGRVNSLNISVAAGIIIYESIRQKNT